MMNGLSNICNLLGTVALNGSYEMIYCVDLSVMCFARWYLKGTPI